MKASILFAFGLATVALAAPAAPPPPRMAEENDLITWTKCDGGQWSCTDSETDCRSVVVKSPNQRVLTCGKQAYELYYDAKSMYYLDGPRFGYCKYSDSEIICGYSS